MERSEEILKLIDEEMGIDGYGSCDFRVGVCYGVKHADRTMIEKACQWITEHIDALFCACVTLKEDGVI